MYQLAAFVLIAFAAPPEAPDAAPGATVELQESGIARGRRLQLGDIAAVGAADEELADRLRRLDLGLPPAEGWGRRVPRALIEIAIREAGIDPGGVAFSGAPEAEVFSRSALVQPEEIEHAAELVLRSALALLGGQDMEWQLVRRPAPRRVPAGRMGVDLTARLRNGRPGRDQALVDVTIRVDGETEAVIPVMFAIRRYREVLVCAVSIPAGGALDQGRVGLQRVDLARYFGEPLEDPALIAGKIAARNLPAGSVLSALDVKEPEVVRKGEMVTMVAARGNLKVTARGIAVQGGALGEVIRLVNPATQKVICARVAGPGVAEVVSN